MRCRAPNVFVVCLSVCLSACLCVSRDPERFSPAFLSMGREAGCDNQRNTGSHAAPSRGRRVLSIVDNPKAVPESTSIKPTLVYVPNSMNGILMADSFSTHWPNLCQRLLALPRRLVRGGDRSSHRASATRG